MRGLGRGGFDVDITVTHADAKGQNYESREFERTVSVSGQVRTDALRLDLR